LLEEKLAHPSHRGIPINVESEERAIDTSIHLIIYRPDEVEVMSGHVLEPAITAKT
jgi:hypothetical protein